MIFKRFLSILLTFSLMLAVAGCGKEKVSDKKGNTDKAKASIKEQITLLYSQQDGFNPYTVVTETNRSIVKLLYEPLVKLDNEFGAVYSLAKGVEISDKTITVTLKSIKFSDGSSLTGDDVVYSFNLAKASATDYASQLYNISSASATDTKTVVFTLLKHDPYCENSLTFPILKKESDTLTDTDGVLLPPIGAGRFKVNGKGDGLIANEKNTSYKGTIKSVRLINSPDAESVTHYAQIGAADMYFTDIIESGLTRMTGEKIDINLNNMVYLGINQNYGVLSENLMRQAISTAIDRSVVCKNAYFNNSIAATGFFNPVWKAANSVQNIQNKTNNEITVENLEKIGYNGLDSAGIRVDSNGNKLQFTLLVNRENASRLAAAKLISSQLSQFGIKISVIEKSYADYLNALQTGDFQLFLAEVKLTDNMDISPLISVGGSAAYGLPIPKTDEQTDEQTEEPISDPTVSNTEKIINGFYNGENTVADVASVLLGEMPFVPICYRTATLFYNDKIENVNTASKCDIYFSIDSYIYNGN